VVAGSSGTIQLTVPVSGGREQKLPIRDIKINNCEQWQIRHLKTIFSCYGRSPFFEFYAPHIEEILKKKYIYLWDLNLEILELILKLLKAPIPISFTETFKTSYSEANISDWRNKLTRNPDTQFPSVTYCQVFEEKIGFLPNLSILDLLFCTGTEAKPLLSM
jgi:hypothetical protein